MAIAKKPGRSTRHNERDIQAFISGAGKEDTPDQARQLKQPIMVRIDPDLLKRIDAAAKRLGISRSAFIVYSTAEHLERMG